MWTAQALKDEYAVSLVTEGDVDLDALNLFYSTNIGSNDVRIRNLPTPSPLTCRRAPSALRGAFQSRVLKYVASDYDILISTYNCCDFGLPAIQCIADFSWDEGLRRQYDPPPDGFHSVFHRLQGLRHCYLKLCRKISKPSGRDPFLDRDLIIANSAWTALKLSERYGRIVPVLYPPVGGVFINIPHEFRRDDFVCIGRISPEKRIERMIEIIRVVRSHGHNIRIRVVGECDASPYAKTIAALAAQYSEWVFLEGRKVGAEKSRILAECRYGIHGREGEAFGISVAEMVKAGCITFAPSEGGPAEILAHEALLYRNEDDAVKKIIAVLEYEALRKQVAVHLRDQAAKFSPELFMAGMREAVDSYARQLGLSKKV